MPKALNDIYTGLEVNGYTVIGQNLIGWKKKTQKRWLLGCNFCSKIIIRTTQPIRDREVYKCDCQHVFENIIGNRYGHIEVIEYAGKQLYYGNKYARMWKYKCIKCGLVKVGPNAKIVGGHIKTCGNAECRGVGSEHWSWKENKIPSGDRRDTRYQSWYLSVFRRDKRTCICCGKKGKIQAHHLDSWNWCEERRFDITNGVTLCANGREGCHYKFHKEYGSGDNTVDEFKKFMKDNYNKNYGDI